VVTLLANFLADGNASFPCAIGCGAARPQDTRKGPLARRAFRHPRMQVPAAIFSLRVTA